jgi:putative NADPH-quinone reductase
MNRVLTILGHPRQGGFNWSLYQDVNRFCRVNGMPLRTIDLYREDFDPVVREDEPEINRRMVENYRTMIEWADVIILISPVWWYRCSTMLEGFFDKVMTSGFAFSVTHDKRGRERLTPLLADKTVIAFLSFGTDTPLNRLILANVARSRLVGGVLAQCFGWRGCSAIGFFGMNSPNAHAIAVERALTVLRRIRPRKETLINKIKGRIWARLTRNS